MAIFERLEGGPDKSSKVMLLIVVLCICLSVVSIIVAVVAISRNETSKNKSNGARPIISDDGGYRSQQQQRSLLSLPGPVGQNRLTSSGKRVWTVAVGHDYGAHEYIDDEGYLAGFNHKVVSAVCSAANIDCRTIWQPYTNCWDSSPGKHSVGGKGLLGGWYDACTGWYKTIPRIHVFAFSQSYLQAGNAVFWVKKDGSFDHTNLNGKKIGFLDGWASDEKCMFRMSKANKDVTYTAPKGAEVANTIIHYKTTDALKDAIVNGDVQAGWAGIQDLEQYKQLQIYDAYKEGFPCMLDGNAMMSRKDNKFNQLWNEGFQKIMSNGVYKQLCDDAKKDKDNRGLVRCVNT